MAPNPTNIKKLYALEGFDSSGAAGFQTLSDALDASAPLTPVGNNTTYPNGSATSASTQLSGSSILYLPAGAKRLRLVFAGTRVSTNTESDLTGSSPMRVSYAVVPAPWNPTKAYGVDETVYGYSTFSNGGNPIYRAVTANTGSMPTPGNTNWVAATQPVRTQCTVRGQLSGGSKTTIKAADGSAITEGWWETDDFAVVGADSACYVLINVWVQNGGGIANSSGYSYQSHSAASGVTTADVTTTGYLTVSNQGATSIIRPTLAIGIPAVADTGKTVAIIGDSIATGAKGNTAVTTATIVSGGSGYTTADVGKRVRINNEGATATSVGESGSLVICAVAAGAVSSLRVFDGGSYAATGTPTGTQTTTPVDATVGTGLTCTVTVASGSFDSGDNTYAQGFMQRALSQANIRTVCFVSPGDTILGWDTRDYSRLELLRKSGASSAIIQLGTNDFTGGATAANMKAAYVTLCKKLMALGFNGVYLQTIIPVTSSTDGFATVANQTVTAQEAVRVAINTWMRSVPSPFTGCIDVAAAVESGGATAPTGKFIANGAIGFSVIDGRHPSTSLYSYLIPALAASIPSLL